MKALIGTEERQWTIRALGQFCIAGIEIEGKRRRKMDTVIKFRLKKQTPGTVVYEEYGTEIISTVYIRKDYFVQIKGAEAKYPKELEIVLKFPVEA